MKGHFLTTKEIESFRNNLLKEEKSKNTIEKYVRDVTAFSKFCTGEVTKDAVIAYKHSLIEAGYAVRSINSMLASLNSLFAFLGWLELRVKTLKVQQQVFCPEEKELTKSEYERLCRTAERKHNIRLSLILQTICGTGIRVSELQFITVEAVRNGEATVFLKGKIRSVFIVRDLQKKLLRFISEQELTSGAVFVTRTGKPLSRTTIWREMKKLCFEAEVNPEKVFPHNLRHLFARVFYGEYSAQKVQANRGRWCTVTAKMVHPSRSDGAWRPYRFEHGRHAVRLFANCVQTPHRFAFYGQNIRIVNYPVADCVGQCRVIQQLMPAGNIKL